MQEEAHDSRACRLHRRGLLLGLKVVDEEGVPAATAVTEGGHLLGACLLSGHHCLGARTITALQSDDRNTGVPPEISRGRHCIGTDLWGPVQGIGAPCPCCI